MRCEPIDAPIGARPRTAGLACRACGCTEERACVTAAGPCSWVSIEPPLCSACISPDDIADAAGNRLAVGAPEGGLFGAELCPAYETPAPHVDLWTSENGGHCARCGQAFVA